MSSSDTASRRMRAVRRVGTKPEAMVAAALRAMHIPFDTDVALPDSGRSRPDIVVGGTRILVYIDGCFWHSCPTHATQPKANSGWWTDKLEANRRRDAEATARLQASGWTVLRFWEHEAPEMIAERVVQASRAAPRNSPRP